MSCKHGNHEKACDLCDAEDAAHDAENARIAGLEQQIKHLSDMLNQAERELAAARRERDLAIAHDRQPYPTAWAYEQVCKALEACKGELAAALRKADQVCCDAREQDLGCWRAVKAENELAAAREDALNEAATICMELGRTYFESGGLGTNCTVMCAKAIRDAARKEKP